MTDKMREVLHGFLDSPLFEAVGSMLRQLKISYTAQSNLPIDFEEYYQEIVSASLPDALKNVMGKVQKTYVIGAIDEDSLLGGESDYDIENSFDERYQTMVVFGVDIKEGETFTRGELATLTRGFNRLARQLPVVVFIRNGQFLSLGTCERIKYQQAWRLGEKLGKVSILRDINCQKPHRGHLDILASLGDKVYPTFDELYRHWLAVFSSEVLTKNFYTDLSEWFAWVIESGEVKFPNDIFTGQDKVQYNHEAVIRLITRLIFVWFLKQKHLIPDEFFDEEAIRENLIDNFDPHSSPTLFYNPEESKYYRLILQNLFFAMLNRPIKDNESTSDKENRRFVTDIRFQGKSEDYNNNNLLRYKSEFKKGGADKILAMANSQVPFLNGGLFECLDHKNDKDPEYGMYYDGFSERKSSLRNLSFPDYFFFAESGEFTVDLSKWYEDNKKKQVKVRGLIPILKNYIFTVEENTPIDQEVSLDPELLGKVFENLLASYVEETRTTARKQTGSFYTPREIVNYMVDESLISYLKRTCASNGQAEDNEVDEELLRNLFDNSIDEFHATPQQRSTIMSALYNCKVLDPACGSGAFPMGILQRMTYVLGKLDPSNKKWKEFIVENSLKKDKIVYQQVSDEAEKEYLRKDIDMAFNQDLNDPDYARKLYLIENCIYGVDLQPIAVQISRLRFFISLVAEQRPNSDPMTNFGIRPLPNLETKFIAANSLYPIDKIGNLMSTADNIKSIRDKLMLANQRLFRVKRNAEKSVLREKITELRKQYADELKESGSFGDESAEKIAAWNIFNQNTAAEFFDATWMFDVEKGFDIVIANPPYVEAKKLKNVVAPFRSRYDLSSGTADLSIYFFELAFKNLVPDGIISFISTNKFFSTGYGKKLRKYLVYNEISKIINFEQVEVFESVLVSSVIVEAKKHRADKDHKFTFEKFYKLKYTEFRQEFRERMGNFGIYAQKDLNEKEWSFSDSKGLTLKDKILHGSTSLSLCAGVKVYRGVTTGYNPAFIIDEAVRVGMISINPQCSSIIKPLLQGRNVRKWYFNPSSEFLLQTGYDTDIPNMYPEVFTHLSSHVEKLKVRSDQGVNWYNLRACKYYGEFETPEKIIWGLTADKWAFALDTEKHYLPSNGYILTSSIIPVRYILGLLNSKLMQHYFGYIGVMTAGGAYTLKAATIEALPIKIAKDTSYVETLVSQILDIKAKDNSADVSALEMDLNLFVYNLYNLTYEEVCIIDPNFPISKVEYEGYCRTNSRTK